MPKVSLWEPLLPRTLVPSLAPPWLKASYPHGPDSGPATASATILELPDNEPPVIGAEDVEEVEEGGGEEPSYFIRRGKKVVKNNNS